ncbi:GNAT family N-acetyltransferase [Alloiococcus sp. CFN-8]|uniref:GNAT family N-acetyltransferase n=1 Tax=Alloiococcus sp. CFN-8 TaxID=3416081 RepID=UPI003CE8B1D3
MNISIEKLNPEMYNEYLYYFDNIGFADHEEWSACYCLESHLSIEDNEKYKEKNERREKAKEFIQNGIMNGYLIYDSENIVGWCNAGDKIDYEPICSNEEFLTDSLERGKVKVLYCIDIAPGYRGRGIADIVIEKVCEDAKQEGYSYVEGYPFADIDRPFQFKGPFRLYEKHGFELFQKKSRFYIMRKKL